MTGDTADPRGQDDRNETPDGAEEMKAQDGGMEAPSGQGGESASSDIEDLEKLAAENADLRDRLLRAMAEMENIRRRSERERADTSKYAISNFARDVLTVGDNLHRVVEHVPAEAAAKDPALKSFLEGVELTERELINMLERHGVTRIEPLGERFDPNTQQAMYEVPNPEVPEGTVVDVMQAGYTIGDRCLRPALVAVAKGGPKAPAEPKASQSPANDDFPAGGDKPAGGEDGGTGNG